jgi:two-component system, chemotaxis family, sensor kinase Cph1
MTTTESFAPNRGELADCDREPIHIPGSVQPHGVLLVLSAGAGKPRVAQASANAAAYFGRPVESILGAGLRDLFGASTGDFLERDLRNPSLDQGPLFLRTVAVGEIDRPARAIAHRFRGHPVLELEPTSSHAEVTFRDLYPLVRSFISRSQTVHGVEELSRMTADEVRQITGFDRVLIYQFDPDWHGHVVAESLGQHFESYLDLWFPASDIPAQARELYRLNRVRLIADANHVPVPLVPPKNPETGQPTDLTYAFLRGVSPVHIEYMKNMGTLASMSIAVYQEDRLWGLIACHHRTPRPVPFEIRTACELIGQYLSQQLAAHETNEEFAFRLELKAIQAGLVAQMASEKDFVEGLKQNPETLLKFANAEGVAILFDDACTLFGRTPSEPEVLALTTFLAASKEEVYHTDSLSQSFADAEAYREQASGLLAVEISKLYRSYLIWFRPEVVQTVKWAGDPTKSMETGPDGGMRIHPRKSFELWKEIVRGRSRPWLPAEVATVRELRNDIVGIVLRKAEEMAQLAAELRRSNEELESFSYSVSHDLRAPYRHIVGYGELLKERVNGTLDETSRRYLDTMMDAARSAGILVDSLLSFSQITRAALDRSPVDLNRLVREVQRDLEPEGAGRQITWIIHPLPTLRADLEMLRIVVRNLLDNAVKYTGRKDEAVIEVAAERAGSETVVSVKDNGAGFDMRYVGKLFGTFQRLHSDKDFPGTGIGLALIRRIVARHGGQTWAEGRVGHGATFYFSFPLEEKDRLC